LEGAPPKDIHDSNAARKANAEIEKLKAQLQKEQPANAEIEKLKQSANTEIEKANSEIEKLKVQLQKEQPANQELERPFRSTTHQNGAPSLALTEVSMYQPLTEATHISPTWSAKPGKKPVHHQIALRALR
jgi:predicted RNase H-like nuclease (RuvC/YqgF family)